VREVQRRQDRRIARQTRVKEQVKSVMKNEIMKFVVDRAEFKTPSFHSELLDLHSNYDANKNTLTHIGGFYQQLYLMVSAIFEQYGDDLKDFYDRRRDLPENELNKKAQTARELVVEQHFLPFLCTYFRDSKCDSFTMMATPEMAAFMQENKVTVSGQGHYELNKVSKEVYLKFRHMFIEERMCSKAWLANKNAKVTDLLLGCLCLILCKKVPTECAVNKIDSLHNKVRLLSPSFFMKEQARQDSALLRITCQPRQPPTTPNSQTSLDKDDSTQAWALNGRTLQLPYNVPVINQQAARNFREDLVTAMVKAVPDFFKEDPVHQRALLALTEETCLEMEDSMLQQRCSEYEFPLFDIGNQELE